MATDAREMTGGCGGDRVVELVGARVAGGKEGGAEEGEASGGGASAGGEVELVWLGLEAVGSGAYATEKWRWVWDENWRWRRDGSRAERTNVSKEERY